MVSFAKFKLGRYRLKTRVSTHTSNDGEKAFISVGNCPLNNDVHVHNTIDIYNKYRYCCVYVSLIFARNLVDIPSQFCTLLHNLDNTHLCVF